MSPRRIPACFLALTLASPAAVLADPFKDESGRGRSDQAGGYFNDPEGDWRGRNDTWRPGEPIPPLYAPAPNRSIPAGHLPPPGECRIWFPDRPAGHQPPPGSCRELRYDVPAGAFLVRG